MLMIVPITACLAFIVIGLVVPSLFAVGRISFPLNITLPIVFAVLVRLFAMLWTYGPNPLVRFEVLLAATLIWQTWETTFIVLLAQVILLSLRTQIGRRPQAAE
jgi:hypothetical protein